MLGTGLLWCEVGNVPTTGDEAIKGELVADTLVLVLEG